MKLYLVFLFTLSFAFGFTQISKLDSLKKQIDNNTKKQIEPELYFKISKEFYNLRIPDSIIHYSLLTLKNTLNDTLKFEAYNMLASVYLIKKDFDISTSYLDTCLVISQKLQIPKFTESVYWRTATLQIRTRNYVGAEKNLLILKVLYEKKDTITHRIASVYDELGVLYKRMRNYKKSRVYLLKALDYYTSLKEYRMIGATYEALASNYINSDDYEKSFYHANKALSVFDKYGLKKSGIAYSQIGRLFFLKANKDYDSSYYYLNKAKTIYRERSDLEDLTLIELHLLNLFIRKKNKDASLKHLNNYLNLRDSLDKSTNRKHISSLNVKLGLTKKEKENLQLKADNIEKELIAQKANTRNWLLALGILVLAVFVVFVWRKYKSENKAKAIISKQKDEIEQQKNLVETLQKELHHRMKNNLSFIDLFINLAKAKFSNQDYQLHLTELQNRMRSMFEVHKQLFNTDDATSVKAKSYIDTLVQNVQEAYVTKNIAIANMTNEKEMLLANTSFPIGLIVNEFITNSYKYAFNNFENGLINITLTSNENNYHLYLKDNGKGLPKDFNIDNLDSFGIETMQLLAKEYNGTFMIDGSDGVSIEIILPKIAA